MDPTPKLLTRVDGLEVHEAEDGLVVFNPATDRVHHLNATASVLFELCDGTRETHELTQLVADLFSLEEPQDEAVETGLRLLIDQEVLVPGSD